MLSESLCDLCSSLVPVPLLPVVHQPVQNPSDPTPHTTGNGIEMYLRVPLLVSHLVIHPALLVTKLLQVPLHQKPSHIPLPVRPPQLVLLAPWRILIIIPSQGVQQSHLTLPLPLGLQEVLLLNLTIWIIYLQLDMVRTWVPRKYYYYACFAIRLKSLANLLVMHSTS